MCEIGGALVSMKVEHDSRVCFTVIVMISLAG